MFFRISVIALGLTLLCGPCNAASDLDRAYRIIAGKEFVDLTHSFGPTTPVWSGFGQAKFTPAFEAMDTDTSDKMDSETYILQHGHYQIEVMANLDKVPPRGAVIVVTWPKVRDGLGFPARAFAILP